MKAEIADRMEANKCQLAGSGPPKPPLGLGLGLWPGFPGLPGFEPRACKTGWGFLPGRRSSVSRILFSHIRLLTADQCTSPTNKGATSLTILNEISHRSARPRPKRAFQPPHTFTTLILFINTPPLDLDTAFNIPETLFSFEVPIRNLSFSVHCAHHTPNWLLHGPTNFKTGGKAPPLDLLDARRLIPVLKHFTLFKCTAVWDEDPVFPTAPISMNRPEEFVVRTESPRHFLMLAMHLAIPETARKRPAVRTLAGPGCGSRTAWLNAPPQLYAAPTRGGLQNIRISGGPTRGRFLVWADEYHDDVAQFYFQLDWDGTPPAQGDVLCGGRRCVVK